MGYILMGKNGTAKIVSTIQSVGERKVRKIVIRYNFITY